MSWVSQCPHASPGKATAPDAHDAHVLQAAVMQCRGFCMRVAPADVHDAYILQNDVGFALRNPRSATACNCSCFS